MTNVVIGAVDRLSWDQIKYWCNSLDRTGFAGKKVIVAMNIDHDTVKILDSRGFEVILVGQETPSGWTYQPRLTVHVERFLHIWNYLRQQEFDFGDVVVTTDVRDVVFQSDPTDCTGLGLSIVAGSECIRYKDEPWGRQNLIETFGQGFYELYKDREIYNVGVLGGPAEHMRDLCLMIYQMAINRPIPICDQAVFNFLLWQEPWVGFADLCSMTFDEWDVPGWAIHCGTVADPQKIEEFWPHLTEKFEKIDFSTDPAFEHVVVVDDGDPYLANPILHQWDRVPAFKAKIEKVYG